MAKYYDIIVVGAGVGGAGTALRASMLGLKTLLVERGRWPGDKNVSFDGMFGSFEEELYPGLKDMVPQDKLMWNISNFGIAFEYCLLRRGGFVKFQALQPDEPGTPHPHVMHICLRNQWDKWFAGLVVKEGVELMNSTLVVDVLRDSAGAVKGIITDKGEKIKAPITIAADGTNSIVARKAGLRPKWHPGDVIVYAQMWYELGPGAPAKEPAIVGTFDFMDTELIDPEEVGVGNVFTYYIIQPDGKRYLMIGAGGMTQPGGKMSSYMHSNTWYLAQRIGQHQIYKDYIDNAKLVSMDCHPVPATIDLGCYGPTYGDGIMVVGDAGIGTVWQGFGVPPAWEAAIIAADVAKKAIDKGDVSAAVLKEYEDRWKQCRWYVDAATEPSIHGKWNTEDGLAPFLRGLVRVAPEVEVRPGHGFWDAHVACVKDVISPALANTMNMLTGPKSATRSAGVSPVESAKISKAEKEWVGKKLSDKVKACVTFIPTKSRCVVVDDSKCTGCGLCYKYCLGGVFDMDARAGKAVVARIETCLECGVCFHICPTDAIDWTYPDGGTGVVCSAPGIKYWDEYSTSPGAVTQTGGRLAPPSNR
jgi:electron transfer flavoprotein-quinone oxidoreductase